MNHETLVPEIRPGSVPRKPAPEKPSPPVHRLTLELSPEEFREFARFCVNVGPGVEPDHVLRRIFDHVIQPAPDAVVSWLQAKHSGSPAMQPKTATPWQEVRKAERDAVLDEVGPACLLAAAVQGVVENVKLLDRIQRDCR